MIVSCDLASLFSILIYDHQRVDRLRDSFDKSCTRTLCLLTFFLHLFLDDHFINSSSVISRCSSRLPQNALTQNKSQPHSPYTSFSNQVNYLNVSYECKEHSAVQIYMKVTSMIAYHVSNQRSQAISQILSRDPWHDVVERKPQRRWKGNHHPHHISIQNTTAIISSVYINNHISRSVHTLTDIPLTVYQLLPVPEVT